MCGDRAIFSDQSGDAISTTSAGHSSMEEPGVFVPFNSKPRTEALTPKRKTFGVRVLEALNGSEALVQLVRMQRTVFLQKIHGLDENSDVRSSLFKGWEALGP